MGRIAACLWRILSWLGMILATLLRWWIALLWWLLRRIARIATLRLLWIAGLGWQVAAHRRLIERFLIGLLRHRRATLARHAANRANAQRNRAGQQQQQKRAADGDRQHRCLGIAEVRL